MGNQNGVLVFGSGQKPGDGKSDILYVSAKSSHNDKNISEVCHRVLPFEILLKIIPCYSLCIAKFSYLHIHL